MIYPKVVIVTGHKNRIFVSVSEAQKQEVPTYLTLQRDGLGHPGGASYIQNKLERLTVKRMTSKTS